MKYACELCGYIYDEEKGNPRSGIRPGTKFETLSEEYECPGCSYKKEAYNPLLPKHLPKIHPDISMKGGPYEALH